MTFAEALAASGLERREARLLLAEAAGVPISELLAHPERPLDESARARFHELVRRRKAGEPVAYLFGRKAFYDLELLVGPDVLIPRPETELLVELALARSFTKVVDLGTGSGAVALAIKRHRPAARVVATDASAAALDVARANARRLALDVEFREGRWFEPLAGERFDLVLSNPPYVASGDPHLAALRFEPEEALVAGADGLAALREIAAGAPAHLEPGGWLFLEHGEGQGEAVRTLLASEGFGAVDTMADLAGIDRVTGGRWKG